MDCVMNQSVSLTGTFAVNTIENVFVGIGTNPAVAGTWIRADNNSETTSSRSTMWGSPYASNRRVTADSSFTSFVSHAVETEAQFLSLCANPSSDLIKIDENANPLTNYESVTRNGYTSTDYVSYRGFSISYFVYWDFENGRPMIFDAVNKTYSIYACVDPSTPTPTPTPTVTPTVTPT
jgi:hypothetical protein